MGEQYFTPRMEVTLEDLDVDHKVKEPNFLILVGI
jgi:hypothetical protein